MIGDVRIIEKEKTKMEKCQSLKGGIRRMWDIRPAKVVPLTVAALGKTKKI